MSVLLKDLFIWVSSSAKCLLHAKAADDVLQHDNNFSFWMHYIVRLCNDPNVYILRKKSAKEELFLAKKRLLLILALFDPISFRQIFGDFLLLTATPPPLKKGLCTSPFR